MFNLQGSEIIFILLLALVVLGPEKLPGAVRRFTRTYAELKKMGSGFQSELKSALDEPMREMRETADLVRQSADPHRLLDEEEEAAAEVAQQERERAHPPPGGVLDPGEVVGTPPADDTDESADDDEDPFADPIEEHDDDGHRVEHDDGGMEHEAERGEGAA